MNHNVVLQFKNMSHTKQMRKLISLDTIGSLTEFIKT